MACRYYDDAIIDKLKKWVPEKSNLRVLKPDETKRLFETIADDTKDSKIKLPVIALSRSKDIQLQLNIKNSRSFDGLILNKKVWDSESQSWKIINDKGITAHINIIPVLLNYQLDIYTKTYDECDEYVRQFLFKLINNPVIYIEIPYNDSVYGDITLQHIANIRVLPTVSDTTDIAEHLFAGQFTRYSIQLELQDAFLFSIPYKNNWKFGGAELALTDKLSKPIYEDIVEPVDLE